MALNEERKSRKRGVRGVVLPTSTKERIDEEEGKT